MLQMPEPRVRELARLALTDLSPVTAKRVDNEWRDQIADYALGQQSGPESAATKGHLRRSEAARVWLGSVIDSLEQFYDEDNLPELPEPDGDRPRARDRRGGREAEPASRSAAATATKDDDTKKSSDQVSPSTREAIKRRRYIIGAGVFAVIIAIAVVVALSSGGGSSNNDKKGSTSAADTTQTNASQGAQLIGQLALKPINAKDKNDVGIAQFASDGKSIQIGVQAKLPPSKAHEAYEVWLYNSQQEAVSLGAQRVSSNGTFSGANHPPGGLREVQVHRRVRRADQLRQEALGELGAARGARRHRHAPGAAAVAGRRHRYGHRDRHDHDAIARPRVRFLTGSRGLYLGLAERCPGSGRTPAMLMA